MIIIINIDFLTDNDYHYQYFEIVKKFTNLKIIKNLSLTYYYMMIESKIFLLKKLFYFNILGIFYLLNT